jgi:hypothetical protein
MCIGFGVVCGKVSKLLVATLLGSFALALAIVRSRRKAAENALAGGAVSNPLSASWGVRLELGPGSTPCAQARRLAGSEHPIHKVPVLPLAGCDSVNCRCHFSYIRDLRDCNERRDNTDRRDAIRFDKERSDRRLHDDRRRTNNVWKDL